MEVIFEPHWFHGRQLGEVEFQTLLVGGNPVEVLFALRNVKHPPRVQHDAQLNRNPVSLLLRWRVLQQRVDGRGAEHVVQQGGLRPGGGGGHEALRALAHGLREVAEEGRLDDGQRVLGQSHRTHRCPVALQERGQGGGGAEVELGWWWWGKGGATGLESGVGRRRVAREFLLLLLLGGGRVVEGCTRRGLRVGSDGGERLVDDAGQGGALGKG